MRGLNRDLKLKDSDVFYLMNLARNENLAIGMRGRKEKSDLWILMNLMFFSHLTMTEALSLTPKDLAFNYNIGNYIYNKAGRHYIEFSYPPDVSSELAYNIRKYKIEEDEPVIRVKKRALQHAFQQLCKEANLEGIRLIDIKFAGEYYRRRDYMQKETSIELWREKRIPAREEMAINSILGQRIREKEKEAKAKERARREEEKKERKSRKRG